MMIVVSGSLSLDQWIGKVYTPPVTVQGNKRRSRREIVLHHPTHGIHRGPFLVIRQVTVDEYIHWYERETGLQVTPHEKNHELLPLKNRFYEVSLD